MGNFAKVHIGTCSWKYDSWKNIFYPDHIGADYLPEYAKKLNTVEIDQWFWSLFEDKIQMPNEMVVREYADAVPDDFKFTIKAPNSITLTHYYTRVRGTGMRYNPNFLSIELYTEFLKKLEPILDKTKVIILQFEYMNKKKMLNQVTFMEKFGKFCEQLPKDIPVGIEIRNPNFINSRYFEFLQNHDLMHVFLQGYYMPMISDVYKRYRNFINDCTVFRLHGPDRAGIENLSGKIWNQILTPREDELYEMVDILKDLQERDVTAFVNVNNHYEGSAPLTINRLKELMHKAEPEYIIT